jgi:TonB family protein
VPIHSAAPTRDHATAGLVAAADGSGLEPTLSVSQVSVPARLLASVPVAYPPAARAAEVEAGIAVEIVVDARGQVSEARAVESSGFGLDEAAVRAVRAYRFSAAQRDGRAVRVRMRWVVQFRLR